MTPVLARRERISSRRLLAAADRTIREKSSVS
jgi:hypothetical protein